MTNRPDEKAWELVEYARDFAKTEAAIIGGDHTSGIVWRLAECLAAKLASRPPTPESDQEARMPDMMAALLNGDVMEELDTLDAVMNGWREIETDDPARKADIKVFLGTLSATFDTLNRVHSFLAGRASVRGERG
jgi:hypothetical protein